MDWYLCAGKHMHIFWTLVYVFITLASLASQSVSASTSSGLVVEIRTNSRFVNVDRESGRQPNQSPIDISRIYVRPGDPQVAFDLSEEDINASLSNQWRLTGSRLSRKILNSPYNARMLSDEGPKTPPTYTRPGPTTGATPPAPPAPSGPNF